MTMETSEGFIGMIQGGTDTEHLAALYFTYLCDPPNEKGADKHYEASLMWTALERTIHKVEEIQKRRGTSIDFNNYLNICTSMCVLCCSALNLKKTVADGESLLALCYRSYDPPGTPPFNLHICDNIADRLNRNVLDREPESQLFPIHVFNYALTNYISRFDGSH
jgi:hypothetical protein